MWPGSHVLQGQDEMSYVQKPTVVMGSARVGQAGQRSPAKSVDYTKTCEAMRAALKSTMASLADLQASRIVSKESLERPLSTI